MNTLEKSIAVYLMGGEADIELANKIYSHDPDLVIPIVSMSIPVLRSTGAGLMTVLNKSEQLEATVGLAEAGRRNYQAEMDAGRPVDQIFFRTQTIFGQLANTENSAALLRPLEDVLRGPDLLLGGLLRVIAAIHSATKGIPARSVVSALLPVYAQELHLSLQVAVSTALLSVLGSTDTEVARMAMGTVKQFVEQMVSPGLPALVNRVKNVYLKDLHRFDQDILIAKLGLYYRIVHGFGSFYERRGTDTSVNSPAAFFR